MNRTAINKNIPWQWLWNYIPKAPRNLSKMYNLNLYYLYYYFLYYYLLVFHLYTIFLLLFSYLFLLSLSPLKWKSELFKPHIVYFERNLVYQKCILSFIFACILIGDKIKIFSHWIFKKNIYQKIFSGFTKQNWSNVDIFFLQLVRNFLTVWRIQTVISNKSLSILYPTYPKVCLIAFPGRFQSLSGQKKVHKKKNFVTKNPI